MHVLAQLCCECVCALFYRDGALWVLVCVLRGPRSLSLTLEGRQTPIRPDLRMRRTGWIPRLTLSTLRW